jgi:hypothetical protein
MVPADFFESDELDQMVAGLKAESANSVVVGWFRVLAAAKRRDVGVFSSEAQLRQALGSQARWIRRYREIGILDGLAIRDWDLWQEDQDSEAAKKLKQRREKDRVRKARSRAEDHSIATASRGPMPEGPPAETPAISGRDRVKDWSSREGPTRMSADSPRTSAHGNDRSRNENSVPSQQSDDAWVHFGDEWKAFREAWCLRGFRHPPTVRQREVLWGEGETGGAVRDWPKTCAQWVCEAPPESSASAVVAYVLKRYHDARRRGEQSIERVAGPPRSEARAALRRVGNILAAHGTGTNNADGGTAP